MRKIFYIKRQEQGIFETKKNLLYKSLKEANETKQQLLDRLQKTHETADELRTSGK